MPKVLVPLAEGFEEMEAVIVVDVLRRADIAVVTASLTPALTVTGSHCIPVVADTTLDQVLNDHFDAVVLPGGLPGATNLRDDTRVAALVQRTAEQGGWTAAICAAPLALAAFGMLREKRFTSHPSVRERLSDAGGTYVEERVVTDGRTVTSRSPGTAFEFALALVAQLVDETAAQKLAAAMLVGPPTA
ncbi:MAG: DJ-1 family glyoxalase III [Chloracidobacterium sp.]|uniref:DJ-1/PfpI family protein n=1 Tax=Chloracidobacterium validum TaxID=2821543 RepID=A0ABX8B8Y6_9BACT|nr:DJ-1 family glyoxalase III [Chloracidobacterium validum]QUW03399.1 DJ-1/PfpI family protein [Chloracidobacterium validum]